MSYTETNKEIFTNSNYAKVISNWINSLSHIELCGFVFEIVLNNNIENDRIEKLMLFFNHIDLRKYANIKIENDYLKDYLVKVYKEVNNI